MVNMESAVELALSLPRSYTAVVGGRLKVRVGRIVYLAFSRDETLMGFAFPRELRDALVASEPEKFLMPSKADLRYNWVVARLSALDDADLRQLVVDAWAMVVPRGVAAVQLSDRGGPAPSSTGSGPRP